MPSVTMTDDAFHRISDLMALGLKPIMLEGFLSATTNGLTFRYGDDTTPGSTEGGTQVPAAASAGFGPAASREAGWDLRLLWVRNTTAGSNAVVALNSRTVV